MRLLLDTHVFLWWVQDDRRLSHEARRAIEAPASQVFVSAASIWEIAIKMSAGRLRWRRGPGATLEGSIAQCGFTELPVTARHGAAVRDLPRHHGDPFDRLLITQAVAEDLRIVSADDVFPRYRVPVLRAAD